MIGLGAFGPAAGALYGLRTLQGKGAIRHYLRGLLDLHFGWQAWLLPILVLGGSTWLAWVLPELWGAPRLNTLLPSLWVFPPYVLIMILLGGGQEELGWRGYILDPLEERLGPWLGNLVLGVAWACLAYPAIFYSGCKPTFHAFRRIRVAYGRLFLVLRLGPAIIWKTHPGRVGCPRLVQRVCSPVPHVGYGPGDRAAAFLDLGQPYICDWFGNDGLSFA
ncbi:MAG: CPBP family intramembrane metalloprotease [Comamonadaceae bacterium]|nr:CPBP family intramembrane metalloprotease [Comamonadaceae bacterium]